MENFMMNAMMINNINANLKKALRKEKCMYIC